MKTLRPLLVAAMLLVPGSMLAASALPTPTPAPGVVSSAKQPAALNRLKTSAASEVDRRLNALQTALNKVQVSSKLAAADKTALVKQLEDEITAQTNLKSQLAGQTGLEAARANVQQILAAYRNYGLLLPKARLLVVADRLMLVNQRLDDLAAQLTLRLERAKSEHKDVTALESDLSNMKSKLANARAQTDGLVAKLLELSTTDYPASFKVLTTHQAGLKTAQADVKAARDSAKRIAAGLKDLKPATPTPSSSPSPSASPSN